MDWKTITYQDMLLISISFTQTNTLFLSSQPSKPKSCWIKMSIFTRGSYTSAHISCSGLGSHVLPFLISNVNLYMLKEQS